MLCQQHRRSVSKLSVTAGRHVGLDRLRRTAQGVQHTLRLRPVRREHRSGTCQRPGGGGRRLSRHDWWRRQRYCMHRCRLRYRLLLLRRRRSGAGLGLRCTHWATPPVHGPPLQTARASACVQHTTFAHASQHAVVLQRTSAWSALVGGAGLTLCSRFMTPSRSGGAHPSRCCTSGRSALLHALCERSRLCRKRDVSAHCQSPPQSCLSCVMQRVPDP